MQPVVKYVCGARMTLCSKLRNKLLEAIVTNLSRRTHGVLSSLTIELSEVAGSAAPTARKP